MAKEYKKINKSKVLIELVLVGGGAILANYGFREMTVDIDAIMDSSLGLKDAIRKVADKYDLPHDWINSDFMKTKSYSKKLREKSVYYKTFYNCIEVRTIKAEYLIAMKLVAGRAYKKDISDIIGILEAQRGEGKALTFNCIDKAVVELYGSWENIDKINKDILINALESENLGKMYEKISNEEDITKNKILDIEKKYPSLINESNIKEIISNIKARDLK